MIHNATRMNPLSRADMDGSGVVDDRNYHDYNQPFIVNLKHGHNADHGYCAVHQDPGNRLGITDLYKGEDQKKNGKEKIDNFHWVFIETSSVTTLFQLAR